MAPVPARLARSIPLLLVMLRLKAVNGLYHGSLGYPARQDRSNGEINDHPAKLIEHRGFHPNASANLSIAARLWRSVRCP